MAWYDKTPKSIDIEELVRQLITNYADKNKQSVEDRNGNTYKVVEYNAHTVNELTQTLVKNVFGVLFSQLSSNGSSKNTTNESVNETIKHIDKTTFDGLTYRSEKDGKSYYVLPQMKSNQIEISNTLSTILTELSHLSQVQETVIRENNAVIKKQHESILRYDNDLLEKTKVSLLNEVIGIADQIKQISDDQINSENYSKLCEDIKTLGDWVDWTLKNESVRKFELTSKDRFHFDPKLQEIVGTEKTSIKSEDGTYKTSLPGYFWTIPMVGSSVMQNTDTTPKPFEFVLRHEQVILLKYQSEGEDSKRKINSADSQADSRKTLNSSEYATTNMHDNISSNCNNNGQSLILDESLKKESVIDFSSSPEENSEKVSRGRKSSKQK